MLQRERAMSGDEECVKAANPAMIDDVMVVELLEELNQSQRAPPPGRLSSLTGASVNAGIFLPRRYHSSSLQITIPAEPRTRGHSPSPGAWSATELKAKKKAFLTRKECIKKKTTELSVLCDVKACTVILGPDGQIETWPENRSDVQEVIELYKKDCLNNKKRKHQHDDHGCKKKQVLEGDEGTGNRALALEDFRKKIEDKIDQIKKQIQVVKSKDQETDSGCSFTKYATFEEPDELDYSFSYPASELGNPLRGGIPPNARPPKISQNLGSHSNVGMLRLGNQFPGDIMSSTRGYIGGFPGNVDGMHLGPLVSSAPMSQLGLQSGQYLPSSLQLQPSYATSFSTTQCVHMPYSAGHTPCSQVPQMQQLLGFSGQLTVPQSQMENLRQIPAPQQGPVMENLRQIPAQQFQPLNQALSQFAQMQSQQKQTQMASFQSSQQAFSRLQQQMQMPQSSYRIDSATAQFRFETESTVIAGVEQFQQNCIDNATASENDPFSTGVEWTKNQICTSSNGLGTGFELPPTQSSPPSSCFLDTFMPPGEEDELAVLLQQFQQTTPTLDSFNSDFGLMDTLGLSHDLTVQ